MTALRINEQKYKDPLFLTILVASLLLVLLHFFLYLYWGTGQMMGEIPWYIPMIHSFTGLAAFSVAFLALGRYHVLREPDAFWIGIGFSTFGLLSIFFILTWPNLLPYGRGIIAARPNTSGWIAWLELFTLSLSLLAAVLLKWPGKKTFAGWRWFGVIGIWMAAVIFFVILSIIYESYLPRMVDTRGRLTSLFLAWNWIYFFLFLSGAVLSTRRYLLTGDALFGYVDLCQIHIVFVIFTALIGSERYDVWYYLSRILLALGFLIMMFGLLYEYILLFRSEQEKSRELVLALQARDDFMSIASHELKTPITTLKLQAQIMQLEIRKKDPKLQSPERLEKHASQLDRQINRLIRLVDDMLDVSRIQSGKLSLNIEETELCSLVKEVLDRIGAQMIENGTVPYLYCRNEVKGWWDRYRIEQVIVNLLTNAMKYGNKKPVSIHVESSGNKALLRVTDRGRGIAKEDQARIFNRFERAVPKDEVTGLGVGLYISEQIIRLHNGRIWVESKVGKGSTFNVELPFSVNKEKERVE